MNRNLELQLEILETKLDAFENADSDKRYNASRCEVLARWNQVVYWLGYDEDEAYCESCGDVLCESDEDIYGALGDYCAGCSDDEKDYCEVCSREIEHGETHCWQCAS